MDLTIRLATMENVSPKILDSALFDLFNLPYQSSVMPIFICPLSLFAPQSSFKMPPILSPVITNRLKSMA